jgi:hypothetical protein
MDYNKYERLFDLYWQSRLLPAVRESSQGELAWGVHVYPWQAATSRTIRR